MIKSRILALLIGDLLVFSLSLFITISVRHLTLLSIDAFLVHLTPFVFLFICWIFIFFVSGLYDSQIIFSSKATIIYRLTVVQGINISLAAIFFFFIQRFGITPKLILLIYLIASFLLLLIWRIVLFSQFAITYKEQAVVIGDRTEVLELADTLEHSHFAAVQVTTILRPDSSDLADEISKLATSHTLSFIIADFDDPRVSKAISDTYLFLASGINFIDAMSLYEEVLGRIPLSVVDDRWAARNVSRYRRTVYDFLKRFIDISVGSILGIASLVLYLPVIIAIRFQDGGPAFYSQVRVGKYSKPIVIYKFRSMKNSSPGEGTQKLADSVTPVGRFLRRFRFDELPQLWSVVRGDLSLVGPRPEIPLFSAEYSQSIPYYRLRYLVKPGLSGWAQLYQETHPHHSMEIDATREKLSYDLYYLRHRSVILDIIIILKTTKVLVSRTGR